MFYRYGMDCGAGQILYVVLFILLIVFLVSIMRGRRGWDGPYPKDGGGFRGYDRSIDILKERYAKGEINKQEFEDKKKDLM